MTRVVAALAAVAVIALGTFAAEAGSPIGELEHRYPCFSGRQRIPVTHEFPDNPSAVSVDLRKGGIPILVVNDRQTFEQPIEMSTFEYLSACEQARSLMAVDGEEERHQKFNHPGWARNLLFHTDCMAISTMKRQGLLRGTRGFTILLDIMAYERGGQSYLGVSFRERADNLRRRCPL